MVSKSGLYKDSLEIERKNAPDKWASIRCLEGETYSIEEKDQESGIWLKGNHKQG